LGNRANQQGAMSSIFAKYGGQGQGEEEEEGGMGYQDISEADFERTCASLTSGAKKSKGKKKSNSKK